MHLLGIDQSRRSSLQRYSSWTQSERAGLPLFAANPHAEIKLLDVQLSRPSSLVMAI